MNIFCLRSLQCGNPGYAHGETSKHTVSCRLTAPQLPGKYSTRALLHHNLMLIYPSQSVTAYKPASTRQSSKQTKTACGVADGETRERWWWCLHFCLGLSPIFIFILQICKLETKGPITPQPVALFRPLTGWLVYLLLRPPRINRKGSAIISSK